MQVGNHTYHIGRLGTFDQLFVVKRLAAFLGAAFTGDVLADLRAARTDGASPKDMRFLGMFSEVLGKMPDEDVLFVINACLRVVRRQQGDQVYPLISETGVHMFADIGLSETLKLCYAVLEVSLGSFFEELRSTLGLTVAE